MGRRRCAALAAKGLLAAALLASEAPAGAVGAPTADAVIVSKAEQAATAGKSRAGSQRLRRKLAMAEGQQEQGPQTCEELFPLRRELRSADTGKTLLCSSAWRRAEEGLDREPIAREQGQSKVIFHQPCFSRPETNRSFPELRASEDFPKRNTLTKIFYLNADSNRAAGQFMEAQLASAGVPYERFRVLEPDEIANGTWAQYMNERGISFCDSLLNGARGLEHVAQHLSHRLVWEKIFQNDPGGTGVYLVLEDNAVLPSDQGLEDVVLDTLAMVPDDWTSIKLGVWGSVDCNTMVSPAIALDTGPGRSAEQLGMDHGLFTFDFYNDGLGTPWFTGNSAILVSPVSVNTLITEMQWSQICDVHLPMHSQGAGRTYVRTEPVIGSGDSGHTAKSRIRMDMMLEQMNMTRGPMPERAHLNCAELRRMPKHYRRKAGKRKKLICGSTWRGAPAAPAGDLKAFASFTQPCLVRRERRTPPPILEESVDFPKRTELVKVIYINLDRNPDRREFMERQLNTSGVPYERFSAVDAVDVKAGNWQWYLDLNNITVSPWIKWKPGSVACPLSHRMVYEKIMREDPNGTGAYLVLEDDVALPPNWFEGVQRSLEVVPDDWTVVKMGVWGSVDCTTMVNDYVAVQTAPIFTPGGSKHAVLHGVLGRYETRGQLWWSGSAGNVVSPISLPTLMKSIPWDSFSYHDTNLNSLGQSRTYAMLNPIFDSGRFSDSVRAPVQQKADAGIDSVVGDGSGIRDMKRPQMLSAGCFAFGLVSALVFLGRRRFRYDALPLLGLSADDSSSEGSSRQSIMASG